MVRSLFNKTTPLVTQRTSQLTVTGLFIALGIIIPYVTGHAFGMPGTLLLPMHFPILLAGLIAGPIAGAITGILTPILSSMLTSMPPVYPMLPIMLVQLTIMGLISGLLTHKARWGIIPSLIVSIVAGWGAYALMFQVLLVQNPGLRALSVLAALGTGIPGLIAQIILVPLIYLAVERYYRPGSRATRNVESRPIPADRVVQTAINKVNTDGISCVVIREGTIIQEADGRGVSPLLDLYKNTPHLLHGSTVVDRIIGKGAAMILVLGGVSRVHGELMSQAGRQYLEDHGINLSYGRCIEVINNRKNDGMCPIERSVIDIDDPVEGYEAITNTVTALKSGQTA